MGEIEPLLRVVQALDASAWAGLTHLVRQSSSRPHAASPALPHAEREELIRVVLERYPEPDRLGIEMGLASRIVRRSYAVWRDAVIAYLEVVAEAVVEFDASRGFQVDEDLRPLLSVLDPSSPLLPPHWLGAINEQRGKGSGVAQRPDRVTFDGPVNDWCRICGRQIAEGERWLRVAPNLGGRTVHEQCPPPTTVAKPRASRRPRDRSKSRPSPALAADTEQDEPLLDLPHYGDQDKRVLAAASAVFVDTVRDPNTESKEFLQAMHQIAVLADGGGYEPLRRLAMLVAAAYVEGRKDVFEAAFHRLNLHFAELTGITNFRK